MHSRDLSEQPVLTLPFRLRGHDGHVSVFLTVNADPRHWGFHLLGLPFDIALTTGLPVCRATISYAGEGYDATMGWIQVVTVTEASGRTWASVDVPPMHWQIDSPFATFGHLPTLFDAPGPNPPRSDETWVAESFLTMVPDVARSRRVRPIVGFRWGYDLVGMRARPHPVVPTTEADWRRCRNTLCARYPTWEFGSGLHADVIE